MKHRPRHQKPGQPQHLTKAVPHIRLADANAGKLAALDELAPVYLSLCQEYLTFFCTEASPSAFHRPLFPTALSERWHRVAIQQAAGIAQSWRTNRANAYQDYLDELAEYQEQQAKGTLEPETKEPAWREWNIPTLKEVCIQANANVAILEPSEDSCFDYWLKVSTLTPRKVLTIPVKLADYHTKALTDPQTKKRRKINSSMTLHKREDGWWLTLSYDEAVPVQTKRDAPVIGIDVGIANFLTTSDGRHYGTFNAKLRKRHQQDREKRRSKAKLRVCLKKKGVEKLPSTSSKSGQRLIRHVRQSINRAVNECFAEHPEAQFAYEQLSVATMNFKARAQNAYLQASNLAHIPKQVAWNAAKRSMLATRVKSAYSSQECSVCHYVDKKNRTSQQTFCCQVCHVRMHADLNASKNIAARAYDEQLRTCFNRQDVKALLMRRHEQWKQAFRLVVVQPPAQLGLWGHPQDDLTASTDVG